MKEFTYTIKDPDGMHMRPAGLLAQLAKGFADTRVTLTKGEQTVAATQVMQLLSLGIKAGSEVVIRVDGVDEGAAVAALEKFMNEKL